MEIGKRFSSAVLAVVSCVALASACNDARADPTKPVPWMPRAETVMDAETQVQPAGPGTMKEMAAPAVL